MQGENRVNTESLWAWIITTTIFKKLPGWRKELLLGAFYTSYKVLPSLFQCSQVYHPAEAIGSKDRAKKAHRRR